MKTPLLLFINLLITFSISGQPAIEWQKSLGGSEDERARSIHQTLDGGYIVAGLTSSNDGDVSDNIVGARSIWIVKLNASGIMEWEKSYGGNGNDEANEIRQTSDGGYIVIGSSDSDDFIGTQIGNQDIIVMKLDANGSYIWGKRFGGTGFDSGYSIKQTSDGGYIAAGNINIPGNLANLWVAKLDIDGTIGANWSTTNYFGGTNEVALSVDQTTDGGFIVAGVANFGTGNNGDFWILKLGVNSSIEWQKTYGGSSSEIARSIKQTNDGGFIVVGAAQSSDGDVTNNYGETDFWVLKLDTLGDLEWQKNYGGTQFDVAFSVQQTSDGDYIIVGETSSDDNDVSGNPGSNLYDYWVIKIGGTGILQWQTCLGGSGNDFGTAIQQTQDDGFIVAGRAFSNNFDVSGNNGRYDFWVVKLEGNSLGINDIFENDVSIYPNPSKNIINIVTNLEVSSTEIYSPLGNLISRFDNIDQINVGKLSNGMYLLKIDTNKGVITKKIIIN